MKLPEKSTPGFKLLTISFLLLLVLAFGLFLVNVLIIENDSVYENIKISMNGNNLPESKKIEYTPIVNEINEELELGISTEELEYSDMRAVDISGIVENIVEESGGVYIYVNIPFRSDWKSIAVYLGESMQDTTFAYIYQGKRMVALNQVHAAIKISDVNRLLKVENHVRITVPTNLYDNFMCDWDDCNKMVEQFEKHKEDNRIVDNFLYEKSDLISFMLAINKGLKLGPATDLVFKETK